MKKITLEELEKGCRKYEENEGRASFYGLAVEIAEDYPLQAAIILLAVWNKMQFRYLTSGAENLVELRDAINECKPLFEKLGNKNFQDVDFDEIGEVVKEIYSKLSKTEGMKYTGASKVMHLFNRRLFVMWDDYIRGNKPKKYYPDLEIIKEGYWEFKSYEKSDAGSYLEFLKDMQKLFGHINFKNDNKTLAKAVDEYNYANITLPIQELEP